MTKAEATYWKEYIERVITSRLSTLTNVEIDAAQIRTFADRHMQLITGQQLLPQTIFRIFVEEFAPISQWQKELADNQSAIMELLEDGPYVALTDEEMDAIFEQTPPEPSDGRLHLSELDEVDENGFLVVDMDEIPTDDNGYILIAEENVNENGYITE